MYIMNKKLNRSQIPFAKGSYKSAYLPIPIQVPDNSDLGEFDDIPGSDKIITTSILMDKNSLYRAFTELMWLQAFNRVDLAPTLYALSLDNFDINRNKVEPSKYQYFTNDQQTHYFHNGTATLESVFANISSIPNLAYPITLQTLVESCEKSRLGEIVGPDKPIADEEILLKHVYALIEKLIHHETLFIDFKASNMCVKYVDGRPLFTFLDFDPQFIIPFSEIGLPTEEIEKACRIFMLVMFVGLFIKSESYGRIFGTSIQTVIRRRYLAKYDIMFMLNTFVKLEIPDYKLCLMYKSPLTMLFHYFENSLHSDINKVYYCQDITQVQYSSGQSALDSLHNTLYNLVCGPGEHNDWLSRRLAHVDITAYKTMHPKIILPPYQRKLFAKTRSGWTTDNTLVRPKLGKPAILPEHDPEMLNEKPSLSPGFGDDIAKNILGENVYNFLAKKKRRTAKRGGKWQAASGKRQHKLRSKRNLF